MKIEVTAREITKTVEMLKMFGVPDMDIETINEAFEARHEHWSDWKFSWGRCVVNALGITIEVYEDSTVKILDAYEDFAPTINKIVGVFAAIKPLLGELNAVTGKVLNKIGNVFKTSTKVELYGDDDHIIIAARYDNDSFTVPSFSGPDGFTDVDAEQYVREHRPVAEEANFTKRSDFGVGIYRALMERTLRYRAEFGDLNGFRLDLTLADLEERFCVKHERKN